MNPTNVNANRLVRIWDAARAHPGWDDELEIDANYDEHATEYGAVRWFTFRTPNGTIIKVTQPEPECSYVEIDTLDEWHMAIKMKSTVDFGDGAIGALITGIIDENRI